MTPRKKSKPYKINAASVVASFSDQTALTKKVRELPLAELVPSQNQPRKYFDGDKIESLKQSIQEKGILSPLLVKAKSEGRYQIVAGERRYRAACDLGLETVPAIVGDWDDTEVYEIALLENLQREDLNPLEETEGMLKLLSLRTGKTREELIALIQHYGHTDRHDGNNVVPTEWTTIEELFQSVGSITPASFRSHRLPLLNLPEDVLNFIRAGQLSYSVARAIARIKNKNQRKSLLQEAIEEKLSLREVNRRIRALKPKRKTLPWQEKWKDLNKTIQRIDTRQIKQEGRINELLNELQELLAEIPEKS